MTKVTHTITLIHQNHIVRAGNKKTALTALVTRIKKAAIHLVWAHGAILLPCPQNLLLFHSHRASWIWLLLWTTCICIAWNCASICNHITTISSTFKSSSCFSTSISVCATLSHPLLSILLLFFTCLAWVRSCQNFTSNSKNFNFAPPT